MSKFNFSTNENFYHLALILSKKLSCGTISGNEKLKDLLIKYNSFENIFKNEFETLLGLDSKIESELEKKLNEFEKKKIDFNLITINDKEYPEYLKSIKGISPIFYYQGNINLLNDEKRIAVVGSRELGSNNINEENKLLERLAKKDYTIVSGLALGADTIAHEKAIEYNLNTIAILGMPLNKPLKDNSKLQEKIAKEHLLISQYPIGIRTFKSHFAHRNMTTVGIANEGTVIVKANNKSGTMHAIKETIKQEKPLYVLESNINKNLNWVDKYKENIMVVR